MQGTTRKGSFVYFRCRLRPTDGHDPSARWPDHPPDVYVPQEKLLEGLLDFYAERVFGRHRYDLLSTDLDNARNDEQADWYEQVAALERSIADLTARRERLLHTLEVTDDADGILAQDVNRRLTQLVHEQDLKRAELRTLRNTPVLSSRPSLHLLDHLGVITGDELLAAPEAGLRMLFEATGLALRYDPRERLAVCQVVIDEGNLPAITNATAIIGGGDGASNAVSESSLSEATGQAVDICDAKHPQPAQLGMQCARSEGFEPPTF
jgi:site-specific DNA recombinase